MCVCGVGGALFQPPWSFPITNPVRHWTGGLLGVLASMRFRLEEAIPCGLPHEWVVLRKKELPSAKWDGICYMFGSVTNL